MAPLRFCAESGCPSRVVHGRCTEHQRHIGHPKLSARQRGYTSQWDTFRTTEFPGLLLDKGIVPACGARLQVGPSPHSRCAAQGVTNTVALELDHDPPLRDHERQDPSLVCDPHRVGFLCKACHTVKTNGERGARRWM